MSVVKSKRGLSKFEVLHHASKTRVELLKLIIRDFGYHKKRVNPYYKNKRAKTKEELLTDQQRIDKEDKFFQAFLEDESAYMISKVRELTQNISMANSIYPTILAECDERRIFQDRAIGNCFQLIDELQFIITSLPVDINKYNTYTEMLEQEIKLLKGWRQSDNKTRKRITAPSTATSE